MSKIIFLDIDGTLCDGSGGIPESAIYAVRSARKNGHQVFLCTGRGKNEVGKEFHDIGFDGAIYYAGGLIEANNRTIRAFTFDQEEILFFLDLFAEKEVGFNLEGLTKGYMNPFGEECIIRFYLDQKNSREENIAYLRSCDMVPFDQFDIRHADISKITLFSKDQKLFPTWQKQFAQKYKITIFPQSPSQIAYCELTYANVSKADAIDILLEALERDLKDTIAYGDSMNDLEMIRHCHIGIAMANGVQPLKDAADDIAEPLLNDGIYKSFVKYHLIDPR